MLPCERKSVEPMAAVTAPSRTAAQHQSLLHFVGEGRWSDEKVLAKVREIVLPEVERHGPINAWIIDDTAFPKQGRHSVGQQNVHSSKSYSGAHRFARAFSNARLEKNYAARRIGVSHKVNGATPIAIKGPIRTPRYPSFVSGVGVIADAPALARRVGL